jgi:multiple sugar transport system ATP-binding protein
MPTVQFRNVLKRYGDQTLIENLNLDIADGEFVVLLGPSGCGKTTLLNILAGLLDVDGGQISINGRDVTDLDPKDRGLAMVFLCAVPDKDCAGNLVFGLSGRRLSGEEIARRVEWAAKLLQIDQLLDRKPAQLSGGQRQRVAIGRALVKQVGVCLFDEPLSNLDAKLRTEMRVEIKKLHGQLRNTVVYVTHDQIEAMTMATRIAVMDKGVIQQAATPDDYLRQTGEHVCRELHRHSEHEHARLRNQQAEWISRRRRSGQCVRLRSRRIQVAAAGRGWTQGEGRLSPGAFLDHR